MFDKSNRPLQGRLGDLNMSFDCEKTVLLVEDNISDVQLLRRSFHKLQITHRLVVVSDGPQAIEYLKNTGHYSDHQKFPVPRLVLLNLHGPNVNGFEVLRRIRGNERLRSVPVIVLTGLVFPPYIKRAFALGANSFLLKPTGIDELSDMVKALRDHWLSPDTVAAA